MYLLWNELTPGSGRKLLREEEKVAKEKNNILLPATI